jgi:hypothetical protein
MSFSREASSSTPSACRSMRRPRADAASPRAAARNARNSGRKISARDMGVSAAPVVPTRTVNATRAPPRARSTSESPAAAAATARGSASTSISTVSRPSSDGWTTRATHAPPARRAVTAGRSRARSASTSGASSSARWRRRSAGSRAASAATRAVDLRHPVGGACHARVAAPLRALVLEVALDAHRAEEELADGDRGRVGRDAVGEGAQAPGPPDRRAAPVPPERHRASRGVARGERGALVLGVGEHVHHAPLPGVEVHLHGVPRRVAEEARLVALVGGGVVDPGLREGQHRRDRAAGARRLRRAGPVVGLRRGRGRRDLREEDEGERAHRGGAAAVAGPVAARRHVVGRMAGRGGGRGRAAAGRRRRTPAAAGA